MLDPEIVSDMLEAMADGATAKKRAREVRTLRGVRGVPTGEIARVTAAVFEEDAPTLADEAELRHLFGTAWDDGLVAIGLLAALAPEAPAEALDIAREWAERVDDHQTADALGTLVVGPALLGAGRPVDKALNPLLHHRRPEVRRIAVSAALAWLPEEISGPSAAALRARVGHKAVRFVDEPQSELVAWIASASLRDEDPGLRKGLRRVLSAWGAHDPDAATAWMSEVRGGMPKMLREAIEKSARKARRKAEAQARWEAEHGEEEA